MQNSVKLAIGAVLAGIVGLVVWWQTQPAPAPEAVIETVAEPGTVVPKAEPAAQPEAEVARAPEFDVARITADGQLVVGGHAAPGQMVEILVDDKVIGTVAADATGAFAEVYEIGSSSEARVLAYRTALTDAPSAMVTLLPTGTEGEAPTAQPAGAEAVVAETATAEVAAAAESSAAEKAAEAAAAELVAAEKAAEAAAELAAVEEAAEAAAAAELVAAERAAEAAAADLAAAENAAATAVEQVTEALAGTAASGAGQPKTEAGTGAADMGAAGTETAAEKAAAEAVAAAEAAAAEKAAADAAAAKAAEQAAAAAVAKAEAQAAAAVAKAAAETAASISEPEISRYALSAPVIILPQSGADQAPVLVKPGPEGVVLLQPAQTEPAAGIVLDRITYSPKGDLIAAGRGQPGAIVRVYANSDLLGEIRCDETGQWETQIAADIASAALLLRFDEVDAEGAVVSRLETPFEYSPVATTQKLRQRQIVVQKGDNLWTFAEQHYGQGIRYSVIFGANSGLIRDPHLIYPGQVFSVPELVDSQ